MFCIAFGGSGTVFKMTGDGTLTTLHRFCTQTGCPDGRNPMGGLVQAANGTLYGTTFMGGERSNGGGTVFSLSTGLAPFVTFLLSARPVGGVVQILGQGFTGATGVSFNGTAATFIVKSDTFLTATVPAGATTGSITVTESSGTLTSNKIFRVTPQILSFSPASGPVGTVVTITGVSLTQTTAVSFGGTTATAFTVNSDTQITATVPAGATIGAIDVRTPGGSAGSPASFTVTP